jgi:DNA-binding response OmpR family regulator
MTEALQGVKILVVEDEYLVATLMEDMLESAGCVVAGPIPRLAQALDAASSEVCDVAVLDINLAGERVYPVADILAQRGVPFVFVTGYGANTLPPEYAKRPRLCKPFRMAELLAAISDVMKPGAASAAH